jgi:GTP-binding protein HflX
MPEVTNAVNRSTPTSDFPFAITVGEVYDGPLDLLLHLVDISHQNASNQAEAVQETLEEIGAGHLPVITVLNKIDRLVDPQAARTALEHFPRAVAISARSGDGVDDLLKMVGDALYETLVPILVRLPYQQGQLISLFHEVGQVERVEHGRGGVLMEGRLPTRLVAQYQPWRIRSRSAPKETEDVPVDESKARPIV